MKRALIIIDMQEGFRFPETELIVPALKKLKNEFSGHVIFTQFFDTEGSMFEKQLNWKTFQTVEKQSILSELTPNNKNVVFRHCTYNPITQELLAYISKENITQVYLSGIYTDVSVSHAAMTLFDNKIETYVIKDATNSVHKNQNTNIQEAALESLSHVLSKDHIVLSSNLLA